MKSSVVAKIKEGTDRIGIIWKIENKGPKHRSKTSFNWRLVFVCFLLDRLKCRAPSWPSFKFTAIDAVTTRYEAEQNVIFIKMISLTRLISEIFAFKSNKRFCKRAAILETSSFYHFVNQKRHFCQELEVSSLTQQYILVYGNIRDK